MSKMFRFALKFAKDNLIIAFIFFSMLIGNIDNTIGRLFIDKPRLVATGSLQRMEVGPISLAKYEDLAIEFETDKILDNWNKRTNLDKSLIPDRKDVVMFSEYADFKFPESETVRQYTDTFRYEIVIENTGGLVAEDIHLISSVTAESAIIERATGAGLGSAKYETLEHNGKRLALGNLHPTEKMEIKIWHEYTIYPDYLTLTSKDGIVPIQQEIVIKTKKDAFITLGILVLVVLFANWFLRELLNIILSAIRSAWKKNKDADQDSEANTLLDQE